MHIEHLRVFNFRNLLRFDLGLAPAGVVVRGPNAQGKTNFLEALYVAATGKSFRAAPPREMLRHGSEGGAIAATFVRQGVRHSVEVELRPRRRGIRVDGRGLRSASKLLELVNVVAFFPDDLRIVKGSPEERRRFLDRAVANHRADFVEATLRYQKALKARNALLRREYVDRHLLAAYEQPLVESGAVLHRCRLETLSELAPLAAEHFKEIMQVDVPVSLELNGGFEAREPLEVALSEALQSSYPRDRARGMTTQGPHRADLVLSLDNQPARSFASQGQQRALVLSLKMAEVRYLKRRLHDTPILLLDDVSSELDVNRTRMLFEVVHGLGCQVLVSTTGAAALPMSPGTQVLEVRGGELRTLGRDSAGGDTEIL